MCNCYEQDLVQGAAEAERKRLREERRIKRALDEQFPTADSAPDEVMMLQMLTRDQRNSIKRHILLQIFVERFLPEHSTCRIASASFARGRHAEGGKRLLATYCSMLVKDGTCGQTRNQCFTLFAFHCRSSHCNNWPFCVKILFRKGISRQK